MNIRNLCLIFLLFSPLIAAQDKKNEEIKWSAGDIYLQAENINTPEPGITIASGYVDIIFEDQQIQADYIRYNRTTGLIEAEGNVTFFAGETSITCKKMEFVVDGDAVFYDALIYSGSYIVRAETLTRDKEKIMRFDSAVITPCTQIKPCWDMVVSSGKIKPGDYIFLSGIFFRVKAIPLFYMPLFYLPLDQETGRTMGFLFPEFGSSSLYGSSITEGFFIPISRSLDTTIYATWYSEKGIGYGIEGRYVIDKKSSGQIDFFYLKEDDTGSERYKFNISHQQTILGWKFTISGKVQSDIQYSQDYSADIDQISSRSYNYINSNLSKSIGPFTIKIVTQYQETILSSGSTTLKAKLPSANISLRQVKLFDSPVYFKFSGNYSILNKETSSYTYDYDRLDLYSQLGANFTGIPWLNFTPSLGFRLTTYSDSFAEGTSEVSGEAIERSYYNFSGTLKGPVFYKVYQTPDSEYADKFKHLIEPSITYNYISTPTEDDRILYYDSVDTILPVNEIQFGLTNRLLANRKQADGKYKSEEILSWTVSQYVSLDDTLKTSYGGQYNLYTSDVTTLSPLISTLKLNPFTSLSVTNKLEYSHDYDELASISVKGSYLTESFQTNIKWSKTFDLEATRVPSDQLIGNGKISFLDDTFDLDYYFAYNFLEEKLWRGALTLKYNHQCFSLILTYDHYDIGTRQEDKFGFNIELTGISGVMSGIAKQ